MLNWILMLLLVISVGLTLGVHAIFVVLAITIAFLLGYEAGCYIRGG